MGRLLFAALLAVACSSILLACGGGSDKPAAPLATAAASNPSETKPAASAPAVASATAPPASAIPPTTMPPTTVPPTVASPTAPPPPTAAATVPPTTVPPPVGAASVQVRLADTFEYIPASVTIRVGGTVFWTWQGGALHDVTSSTFPSDPAGAKMTGTYQFTFSTPGSYSYVCTVDGMQGVVIVQ